jgi:hypothetical protein
MTKIKAKDLKLADVISTLPGDHPFSTAIVTQVKDGAVKLFRPYALTADFSYTGGVIPYIGTEEYTIFADDKEVDLFSRKDLK